MKIYIFKFVFLLLIIIPIKSFATAQVPDYLVYNGDTLMMFANPLSPYLIDHPKINDYIAQHNSLSTGCWRGYVAYWELKDGFLYLKSVRGYKGDMLDLSYFFPGKNIDAPILADWYSGEILCPYGNLVYYIHDGYRSIYEYEKIFLIEKGILKDTQTFDNTKSKLSKYPKLFEGGGFWAKFAKSQINYSKLPEIEKKIKIVIAIDSVTDNGKIEKVHIIRGYNDIFDQEAIRVVKSIPQWDVLYKRGKPWNMPYTLPVMFFPPEERDK